MEQKKRVDDEWKQRAEEEKRKITESMGGVGAGAETAAPGARPTGEGGGHRLDFLTLVSQIATQAAAALGQLDDPRLGGRHVDLELARDSIDILTMLEEKTKGNLDPEERVTLDKVLQQLRLAYGSLVRAAQQRAMETPPPGSPEAQQ